MEETQRGRDVGEFVLALLVDPSALQHRDGAGAGGDPVVAHPVTVRFADDLSRGLQLGERYDVVLCPGGRWLEAWGLHVWLSDDQRRVDFGITSRPLTNSVQKLWVQTSVTYPSSPCAFVVALASHLGGNRYPRHSFMHLKIGLLLSLASQGLEHSPVPVVALGADPGGAALLWRCLALSRRGLAVTGSHGALSGAPTGVVHTSNGVSWMSAGPLILAKDGACLLGCWSKWGKSADAALIKTTLESGRCALVSHGVIPGSTWSTTGPSVPLKCAVWTYWAPGKKPADISLLKTLINTFGVPLLSDSGCEEAELAKYLLQGAVSSPVDRCVPQPEGIPDREIMELLSMMNAQPVTLSDEASRLVQDYFVASRRVRPDCLPVNAVGIIAAMTEAVARLSMRKEATSADVVLVVWIYEIALTTVFGPCLVAPLPENSGLSLQPEDVTGQINDRLCSMKMWLENFIRSVLLSSLSVAKDNRVV